MSEQNISGDVAAEILRQAEIRLQSQLSVGIAADQRAGAFVGAFVSAVVALGGGSATAFALGDKYWEVAWAALASAVGLLLAAVFAAMAARPGNFHIPGNRWKILKNVADQTLANFMLGMAARIDERIDLNNKMLLRGAKRISVAIWCGIASPVLGGVVYAALTAYARCIH